MKAAVLLTLTTAAFAQSFRVAENRVEILSGGEAIAASPAEGLWSIACDWRGNWPADWRHATPRETTHSGEWTILRGQVEACGGVWLFEDAYRIESSLVRGLRRIVWKGKDVARKVTLSVRFQAPADNAQAVLPGIVYHGNPSGARSGRVPVTTGQSGEESIYEEHRYPMPFASLELRRGANLRGFALHTVPSPVANGNLPDQWWSLGLITRDRMTGLVALSGPTASNGQRSVIKGVQRGFMPYENAWLDVEPGAIVEKSFYLDAWPVAAEGSAFQHAVRRSIALFQPFFADDLPEVGDIVRAKYRYAKTRWKETPDYAIFQKYEDRPFGVMGWTGQAEAPGYALQVLNSHLGDPDALRIAQKSLDFLATTTFDENGFRNWYDLHNKRWERTELLNQGQAMLSIARAVAVGRTNKRNTSKWEMFLRHACDVHSTRILAPDWKPLSTSEASFIAPLVKASQLFDSQLYRRAALHAAEHYARRHVSMREPYWGGTSDAQSEDKEGAALAFAGFLELYELTKDHRHLEWARHACDVMLTYTYVWDVPMPPGRLADHRLRTRGWTSVSPQNQHLDVWGAITAPDVYRLGQIDRRDDLMRLAIVMYRSAGQLIDAYGSQGEQLQQTNYAQRGADVELRKLRGDYHEAWTVFWITAHFLTGAARFVELGVPVF